MKKFNKSKNGNGYIFDIYVSPADPEFNGDTYTAFVSLNQKLGSGTVEIAGVNVRDNSGKRQLFNTIEEAFKGAEGFIKGFNVLIYQDYVTSDM